MNVLRPVAVVVALSRSDGRYLLIERAEGHGAAGYWMPVSGRVEPGETFAETATRECFEEVGIAVHVATGAGAELARTETHDGRYELVWLAARSIEPLPEVIAKPDEVAAWRWVTVEECRVIEPMFDSTRAVMTAMKSRLG